MCVFLGPNIFSLTVQGESVVLNCNLSYLPDNLYKMSSLEKEKKNHTLHFIAQLGDAKTKVVTAEEYRN